MLQPRRKHPRKTSAARELRPLIDAAAALVADQGSKPATEFGVVAQVCRLLAPQLPPQAWQWVADQLPEAWRERFIEEPSADVSLAEAAAPLLALTDFDALAGFYEQFLQAHDPHARKQRGAFYTPPPLARFIVRGIDRSLRDEFGLASGLLDTMDWQTAVSQGMITELPGDIDAAAPLVRILDPALGAGMFLTELIDHARQQVADDDAWNLACASLLPRLHAVEIEPAAALIAVVRMALALDRSGYRFESASRFDLKVRDALAEPLRPPCTVVLGNPPFSGISTAKHAWLDALLRGRGPAGEPRASYFDFAGAPMGERKHWLQDDYVKFLRIAHEQIETTGLGIVGLVTNHGYLDNITFRGLREKLASTFERISVIDLHGNSKRRERSPDGSRDENVFAIEQGVAIGMFRRLPKSRQGHSLLERCDVWGTRAEKLAAVDQQPTPVGMQRIATWQPGQAFHMIAPSACPNYEAGWPLDEAMPVNSTAPVTARDHFVIAMTRAELIERCEAFCDSAISDDAIRQRYFQRTRSRLYAAGDTRGWKLPDARARLRELDWQACIRRVLYRPFDWRYILWAEGMIDWPRHEVMSHLLSGDNLALIARRQSPAGQPWNFAWVTAGLTVDGVIRSDNRGSESVFPLWLDRAGERQANFHPRFLGQLAAATGEAHAPQDVFHYIYALLHAPEYRRTYETSLAKAFPRILLPQSREAFDTLARYGAALAACHQRLNNIPSLRLEGELPALIAPGHPRCDGHRLWLNTTSYYDNVSPALIEFSVGSHRVATKLLKDRRGRMLSQLEAESIGSALAAIAQSQLLTRALDEAWDSSG